MKTARFRPSVGQFLPHWIFALALLAGAISIYIFMIWIPRQGIALDQCPPTCVYDTDCHVPGCSDGTECHRGACVVAGGHKAFFTISMMTIGFGLGFLWLLMAYFKTTLNLVIDDEGVSFKRLFYSKRIPWDEFLGITFHGVNTRFGRDATVYTITGDGGLLSFFVMGLPKGISTREIELGAFFYLKLSTEECSELLAVIEERTGAKPEAEHEW